MKNIFKKQDLDAMVLSLENRPEAPAVEKDPATGLLTAFRVFAFGPVSVTREGVTLSGEFTQEHADSIVAHFNKKGEKIPVDSNHMLHQLAEDLKKEESEIAALTGEKSLAMGFGKLEKRADGLWLSELEWLPLGAELMRQKVFRYFSPVLRGLADGNLRITSLSVLNSPAIDNLDSIAAAAEQRLQPSKLDKIRDILQLTAEDSDDAVCGALQGLIEKIKDYDAVKTENSSLKLAAEKQAKEQLIDKALKDGQLANSLLPWAKEQSVAALSAFLKAAPVIVPLGKAADIDRSCDAEVLTASDKAVCDQLGLSAEDYLKVKKLQNKKE